MSFRLVPIVEGHGEVEAVPVLLRRVLGSLAPERYVEVRRPIHTPRDRFLNREDERRRILGYALLACAEADEGGHVLVLFDADDADPEGPRNAKGLVTRATGGSHGETADQTAFSAAVDIGLAGARSRSSRKLVKECRRALGMERTG